VEVIVIAVVIGIVGCLIGLAVDSGHLPQRLEAQKPGLITASIQAATTVGDASWVALDIVHYPSAEHSEIVLKVVDQFKHEHPKWDVYDWKVERYTSSGTVLPVPYGIWFQHRLKEPIVAEKE
jgi:hypothetical protein